MTTPVAPEVATLRREIQDKYTEVASSPDLEFHFHHGLPLAKILDYKEEHLAGLPEGLLALVSQTGLGNMPLMVLILIIYILLGCVFFFSFFKFSIYFFAIFLSLNFPLNDALKKIKSFDKSVTL